MLAGIVRAVEEAQGRKPRLQAVADRAVGRLRAGLLVLAVATIVRLALRGGGARAGRS